MRYCVGSNGVASTRHPCFGASRSCKTITQVSSAAPPAIGNSPRRFQAAGCPADHPIPGQRWYGPYATGGHRTVVTVKADGGRETGAGPADGRPEILLVGDSYTMGKAVSDDETFAAGLQRLRPDLRIVNQGVIGYGTFQSLLLLEQLLRNGARPARAISTSSTETPRSQAGADGFRPAPRGDRAF